MLRLANTARHPVTLDDGTILAASGTEGSIKEVDSISDDDRSRYIDGGIIADLNAARATSATAAPTPDALASTTSREATDEAAGNRRGGGK
jgi:hypothetical protein